MTRKFKNMYFRGTIEAVTDFPLMANRKDGHVYAIYSANKIADPFNGTDATLTEQAVTSIITNEGHQDSEEAGYKKITGVASLFDTNMSVGAKIVINGETRYVEAITSELEITLNKPLNTEIALTDGIVKYDFLEVVGSAKKVNVDDDHATNKKLYGVGTSFTTEFVAGDEITLVVNNTAQKRTIASITDNTELVLTEALYGDLTDINEDDTYFSAGVTYLKTVTGEEFDNSTLTNQGKYILWTETPSGYDWKVMFAPSA